MAHNCERERQSSNVEIPSKGGNLPGELHVPVGAHGLVIFAHGSGSSRFSPRNVSVARHLQEMGLATLLMDLLHEEEAEDRSKVFDIGLLAARLADGIRWACGNPRTSSLSIGLFGASTGAAAALTCAAELPQHVSAVVSRGGRPDLAWDDLPSVQAPTLLIVGSHDEEVLRLNESALERLRCPGKLVVVPGATHLFSEPGTLEMVAGAAERWFSVHLSGPQPSPRQNYEPLMFRDRADAARHLAKVLMKRCWRQPVVMAIPRGGVALGAVLAQALDADLDLVLARKLRAPGREEYAIGAIAEDGEVVLNPDLGDYLATIEPQVKNEIAHQKKEIARRAALYRASHPAIPVRDRSVIVVDDGIATGSTMIAALHTLRTQRPHELVVAVPVAPPDRLAEIATLCDDVVCLSSPANFQAVGQFYENFRQVEDDEVVRLLDSFVPSPRR